MYNMKNLISLYLSLPSDLPRQPMPRKVNALLTKQLPEAPGKEIEVITVNYAPGAVDAIHRHDSHSVVYVLEGEVEMEVRGGMLQRLGPGQAFYESPEDVHIVSRNASKTKPAKFVVCFIKNEGAPILTPVHWLQTRAMYFPDEIISPKTIFLLPAVNSLRRRATLPRAGSEPRRTISHGASPRETGGVLAAAAWAAVFAYFLNEALNPSKPRARAK